MMSEKTILGYFRCILFSNNFILDRVRDIKGNKRVKCNCDGCYECYYFFIEDYLNKEISRKRKDKKIEKV